MAAIAKGPITYTETDAVGRPIRHITYSAGDYVPDEHHAVLKGQHHHNLTAIGHDHPVHVAHLEAQAASVASGVN